MHAIAILTLAAMSALRLAAQVTLTCDFTDPAAAGKPMAYHWDVYNRISPVRNCNPAQNPNGRFCVVRPLGGKASDGRMLLDEDTCKVEGGRRFYDWAPLKRQIANVQARGGIHQLVLDNPPWAFQAGIDRGTYPAVDTYGNAWPPNDPAAWADYIEALLKELIRTYGRRQVEGWRFGIGREIGTGGHWRGDKETFFQHYENTARVVRRVLPAAKIGSHFLWASSKHSWGPEFVAYCHRRQVPYDFVGISFYPFYNRLERVDLDTVYRKDIAPIKDRPDWNPGASLEIHEFALIVSMGAKGSSYVSAPPEHQASFAVMLQKMMYEHSVSTVFQWGNGPSRAATTLAFLPLKGHLYHSSRKSGPPDASGRMIDAVFCRDREGGKLGIVAYHYNADSKRRDAAAVTFNMTVPQPAGTKIAYRLGTYRKQGDDLAWSGWTRGKTASRDSGPGSEIVLRAELSAFSFLKYEVAIE